MPSGKRKMKDMEREVRERWGNTAAYREYEARAGARSEEAQQSAVDGLNAVFGAFAACYRGGASPESPAARELVERLQGHITTHFYTCTPEILSGLGQMYVQDQRFARNIDAHGEGTAAFVSAAITAYCRE